MASTAEESRPNRIAVALALAGIVASSATATAQAQGPLGSESPPVPAPHKYAVDLADSDLREAVLAGPDADLPADVQSAGGDQVIVEVIFRSGEGADARDAIRAAEGDPGITVPGELVQAEVPLDGLEGLEADPAVKFVRPPLDYSEPAEPDGAEPELFTPDQAGSQIGQQIQKTNATTWHAAGITGAGVKIGIIDGFQDPEYSAAVAAGEIPAASGAFCLDSGAACSILGGASKHGVGVAETVSDMAPSAELYLADVSTSADTQAALNYFASQGVRVVTRSQTGRYDGPGDGTGPIASVIESSAVNLGMFYLNSAGNGAGRNGAKGSYWRGNFVDTDLDGYLEFNAAGDEYMAWDCSFQNGLRWSDWGEGALATDYDLYVYNSSFVETDSSTDTQGGGMVAPPLELATGCTTTTSYIRIRRIADNGGDTNDTLEFMTNGAYVEHDSNPFSASGPMADLNSAGAVSVGAVDPALGTTIANYSSEGPTNDGRIKPDLAAAACVKSLTYSPGCFNGTSAATPVAAGAAALMLSAGFADSPQSLKTQLLSATTDRGAAGPDNVYGQGELLLPDPDLLDRVAPVVQAQSARGKGGKRVNLRYTALDNFGVSRETVTVIRKGRTLTRITGVFSDSIGGSYGVTWKVPKSLKGRMEWCVDSVDPAGNAATQSCAKLKVKKKKKRRRR